jgi:hypothetical protein
MLVLGTEAPILHELQQPSTPFAVRLPHSTASMPRPLAPPPIAPPMPYAASDATIDAPPPIPIAFAPAPGNGPSGAVAVAPGPGPTAAAIAAGNVSLKDIARTAAREAERELILRMLTRTRWNRKEAAEILGISYKALLYKIKENGLDKAS